MKGYTANIERLAAENSDFRRVLYTAKHSQLVLMSLKPGEEIGNEVHTVDQFFRFEKGKGKAILNQMGGAKGEEHAISDGSVLIVPAGTWHNIVNVSKTESLKLYTLYCPPHHKDGVVHPTKAIAEADKTDEFKGGTTE
ncbi:MAG TPA: cupin domain-containing protein [Candidatus Paceibacterota bacterium]|nr:cupin domain-containing protein [Candidatus Paceibacterota bacterium]